MLLNKQKQTTVKAETAIFIKDVLNLYFYITSLLSCRKNDKTFIICKLSKEKNKTKQIFWVQECF